MSRLGIEACQQNLTKFEEKNIIQDQEIFYCRGYSELIP